MKIKAEIKLPVKFYSKKLADVFLAVVVIIVMYCLCFFLTWISMGCVASFIYLENSFQFWLWNSTSRGGLLFTSFVTCSGWLWYLINKQ